MVIIKLFYLLILQIKLDIKPFGLKQLYNLAKLQNAHKTASLKLIMLLCDIGRSCSNEDWDNVFKNTSDNQTESSGPQAT